MKTFMFFVGVIMMIAGVVFGLWAGVWWAFIGGLFDIIMEIKAPEMDMFNFGLGLLKFFFAGIIGWISGVLAIIPGCAIAGANR